jgi:hypothetical protein
MNETKSQVLRGYVEKLLKFSQAAEEFQTKCAELGISVEKINLNEIKRQVQQKLEELPILTEGVANKRPMYFILSGDGWWPVHAGNETRACGKDGWLNYRIDYTDGTIESGVTRPFRWAHCTADDQPNYHWLDAEEEPCHSQPNDSKES